MKNILRTSLVTVLLLGLSAGRVHAGNDGWVALGGFVAGVITGAAIENSRDRDYRDDPRVIVHASVGRHYGYRDYGRHYGYRDYGRPDYRRGDRDHRGHGYWEVRRVRVYVPGRWEVVVNHCGSRLRIWKGGYYTWRNERVWVPCINPRP